MWKVWRNSLKASSDIAFASMAERMHVHQMDGQHKKRNAWGIKSRQSTHIYESLESIKLEWGFYLPPGSTLPGLGKWRHWRWQQRSPSSSSSLRKTSTWPRYWTAPLHYKHISCWCWRHYCIAFYQTIMVNDAYFKRKNRHPFINLPDKTFERRSERSWWIHWSLTQGGWTNMWHTDIKSQVTTLKVDKVDKSFDRDKVHRDLMFKCETADQIKYLLQGF